MITQTSSDIAHTAATIANAFMSARPSWAALL
jgi:hypothetical protein